jgi:phage tail sheath gpL-like
MTNEQLTLEIYSANAAIELAKVERVKSDLRVAELEYRKACFIKDTWAAAMAATVAASDPAVGVTPPPTPVS